MPDVTLRTSAPSARIRSTFGAWRWMSSSPMNTTHGNASSAQAVAVADAVLAGPGLRDDSRLTEPARQQRLAERVVDLVRAGVGEILALEIEADRADRRSSRRPTRPPRLFREPVGAVEGRRAAGVATEQVVELGPEPGVVADGVVRRLELLERRDERLGHVAAAEVALHPPPARAVDLEQARVHGRGTEGDVGPVAAGIARTLGEQRDAQRVLPRPLALDARAVRPRGDVDARRGDRRAVRRRRCPRGDRPRA